MKNPVKKATGRTVATAFGLGLFLSVFAPRAMAEDHALLISVSEIRSGLHGLDVANLNRDVMLRVFKKMGFDAKHLTNLHNAEATRNAVWDYLDRKLDVLNQGDRLFLYYTGHGIAVDVAKVPVRAYFTYDARQGRDGKFQPDTLITDHDLMDWLDPIRRKGVEVVFFRECCFTKSGDLQTAAPGDAPPTPKTVGSIELSACKYEQEAQSIETSEGVLGIFTHHLSSYLEGGDSKILAGELFTHVDDRLRLTRGQSPVKGGHLKGGAFDNYVLFDRTELALRIVTKDAETGQEIRGAEIFVEGELKGTSPLDLKGVKRDARRVYPKAVYDGFVTRQIPVDLDPLLSIQEVNIELKMATATIEGVLSEKSRRKLKGVTVSFVVDDGDDFVSPRFRRTETPDATNAFKLTVPPGRSYSIVVSGPGSVLDRRKVNEGNPLELDRLYDLGVIEIDLPRAGPSKAENIYATKLQESQSELNLGNFEKARIAAEEASAAASLIPDSDRKRAFSERIAQLKDQIERDYRAVESDRQYKLAVEFFDQGDFGNSKKAVDKAIELNPKNPEAVVFRIRVEKEVAKTASPHTPSPKSSAAPKMRIHEKDGAAMVFVAGGQFTLGDANGEEDEKPGRTVTMSSYYIDRYEVTWGQYRKFCDETKRTYPKGHKQGVGEDRPVVYVSWDDASAYAEWAGKHLPTEAQWEYAAEGPRGGPYPWGSDAASWRAGNPGPHNKGQRRAAEAYVASLTDVGNTPDGASWCHAEDMAGSVWEWCADFYRKGYSPLGLVDPTGPSDGGPDARRVLRGGSYVSELSGCRTSNRNSAPGLGNPITGFRCVWIEN